MQSVNVSAYHTVMYPRGMAKVAMAASALAAVLALSACGTTSPMVRSEAPAVETLPQDLSAFKRVVVLDFEDQVSHTVAAEKRDGKMHEMEVGCKHFADLIAKEIQNTIQDVEVARGENAELTDTLVIA